MKLVQERHLLIYDGELTREELLHLTTLIAARSIHSIVPIQCGNRVDTEDGKFQAETLFFIPVFAATCST